MNGNGVILIATSIHLDQTVKQAKGADGVIVMTTSQAIGNVGNMRQTVIDGLGKSIFSGTCVQLCIWMLHW